MASVRVTWVEVSVPEPQEVPGGTTWNESATETVSASDSATGGIAYAVATSESATSSDSGDAALAAAVAASETAAGSDSASAALDAAVAASETAAGSDSASAALDAAAAASETASGADSASAVLDAVAQASESVTASDSSDAETAVQQLLPASDVSAGAWSPSTGGSLFAMIDEAIASDADYIFTSTAGTTCEVQLQAGVDPAISNGHKVRVRAFSPIPSGTLTTALFEGTTQIASWTDTMTGAAQDFEHTLTGAQADAITDYTNLRLKFTANA